MHSFEELTHYCTEYMLRTLAETQSKVHAELETSGSTGLVKALQMIHLQKAFYVVGVFSMFDAMLQDSLQCADGFQKAGQILEMGGETALKERFIDLQMAVNVLKHGRGRSYDALVAKVSTLPFRVKLPHESFFEEGDISEIATLIEIDDKFVRCCADTIRDVISSISRLRPDFIAI